MAERAEWMRAGWRSSFQEDGKGKAEVSTGNDF